MSLVPACMITKSKGIKSASPESTFAIDYPQKICNVTPPDPDGCLAIESAMTVTFDIL